MAALPVGASALAKVPGITTEIMTAAAAAFQESYVIGLRTTCLSSLSFGVVGIIGESSCLVLQNHGCHILTFMQRVSFARTLGPR